MQPALRKHRGPTRKCSILEDSDLTGYTSNIAIAAKKDLGIEPIAFPAYSPDLNPLDFALWSEVESRMQAAPQPRNESVDEYKVRLRRTAMRIPTPVVRKMLGSMKARAESVYANGGGHIARD